MKLLTRNGLLAFFFSSEEEKKKHLRERVASDCMYTKLCAFREDGEEIQLVAGLITFLLLDTCEIPKHQLLDSYIYDVLHA